MILNRLRWWLSIVTLTFVILSCDPSQKKLPPAHKGDTDWQYFGLASPGNVPQVFSPDIVSTSRNERDFAISPAGNVMFYSIVMPANNLSLIAYLSSGRNRKQLHSQEHLKTWNRPFRLTVKSFSLFQKDLFREALKKEIMTSGMLNLKRDGKMLLILVHRLIQMKMNISPQ
jgi:hypothetical protein